jgi:hypothetical protein
VGFQREMTGVVEAHDGIAVVALEGLRSGRHEKWIVPA